MQWCPPLIVFDINVVDIFEQGLDNLDIGHERGRVEGGALLRVQLPGLAVVLGQERLDLAAVGVEDVLDQHRLEPKKRNGKNKNES